MIPFELPNEKRCPRNLKGLREQISDLISTPPPEIWITPAWPLDLLCGLLLLTSAFLAYLK